MTALAEACADVAAMLPRAAALIAEPDTDGTASTGQTGSRPPWNGQAANAVYDAAEGLRRLEASLRLAVTGRPGPRRGGSDANTTAAITAIGKLGDAVTTDAAATAARVLARWVLRIEQLPAIDTEERWQRIRAGDVQCPYCQMPNSLRVAVRSGRVTCLRYGACWDGNDQHPVGTMELGAMTGQPMIVWGDGMVQVPP